VTRATVGACECCRTPAGPRVSLHWHAVLRAALCHRCNVATPLDWFFARRERLAAKGKP
jgi:hypothetical protein